MTTAPHRQPVRYYGSKWRIAPWLIAHFPPHHAYVEPFAGGASVFFRKPPSPVEVLNDMDDDVVNFFRVLRERPRALLAAIRLTPWSREEYHLSYEPADDPVERARRFYVRSKQTRGGPSSRSRSGWRFERRVTRTPHVRLWRETDHLRAAAERLRQAYIEHDDALAILRRYDSRDTLFYVDPPYVITSRRNTGHGYVHDYDDDDHRRLIGALRSVSGLVILSGYPCPLYDALVGDWPHADSTAVNDRSQRTVERIWLSPRTAVLVQAAQIPMAMEMIS